MPNLATLHFALSTNLLKKLTLATADLREESYDTVTSTYRLDLRQAADLACELLNYHPEFAPLVALALHDGTWNDVLDWAGDFKGRAPDVKVPDHYSYPPLGVPTKET